MTGLISAFLLIVLIIAAYIVWEVRLIRKYGIPQLPDDIRNLDERIENEVVRMDLSGFTFDKEWLDRKTFVRDDAVADGTWRVTIELDGDRVVAYRGIFRHAKGWWLGCKRERCSKTIKPRIVVPGE